eukprot:TRINITY_DN33749_c0_g1_i2.p1 TRINITY_DN33749_c0_g1~~TRINITY_DN33749_c0_g1_i2.p1  ORF type:complete len:135 (-),score=10.22 TRINITY_DN33749_c0_g1_i2:7-411(-)
MAMKARQPVFYIVRRGLASGHGHGGKDPIYRPRSIMYKSPTTIDANGLLFQDQNLPEPVADVQSFVTPRTVLRHWLFFIAGLGTFLGVEVYQGEGPLKKPDPKRTPLALPPPSYIDYGIREIENKPKEKSKVTI